MTARENRLTNLRAIHRFEQMLHGGPQTRGSKTAASRAISHKVTEKGAVRASDVYITQLVRGYQTKGDARPRTPSETLCVELERAYGLPSGWMSRPHDDPEREVEMYYRQYLEFLEVISQNEQPYRQPLVAELRKEISSLETPSEPPAKRPPWPLPRVDERALAALAPEQIRLIEAALFDAADQMGISIRSKRRAA